ncbi:hypothetical protein KQH31_15225, partial [Streptomyces sp. CHA15]|nr:hypothetical protein [Streptomyces sp. CHA15]
MSGSPAPDPDGFDSLLALVNDASARRTRDEPPVPYDQEADGRTGDARPATGDDRTTARPSAEEPAGAGGPSAGHEGALAVDKAAAGTAWPAEYGPEPPGPATPPPARSGGAPRAHGAPDGET